MVERIGEAELAELLASDEDYAGHADEDAVPEAPEIPVSRSEERRVGKECCR